MPKRISTAIIILLVIIAIFNLIRQISDALQASNRLDQAVNGLSKAQAENQALKDQLAQTKQYDFIEKEARNKLNLARPNETVVVVPQSAIDQVLNAEKVVPVVKIPYWQGWLKLIFH